MSLQIPQARDYHDENDHPSYPQSLDRGVRSERPLTLAVAEMYVQGVSTRKASKIQNALAHVPKMTTAWMVPGTCGASSTPTGPLKRSAVSVRRSPATSAAPFHAMRLNRMFSPWPALPGKSF